MASQKAARRYAKSLLEVSLEQDQVERTHADIELIHNTINGSRELFLFLRSPIVQRDKKQKVLHELFGDRISDLTRMFIEILIRKEREQIVPEITESFIDLYNELVGIQKVQVRAAEDMNKAGKDQLLKILEKKTGKKIQMEFVVDEGLKGGLLVRIDDTVYDGSVKHKIEELQNSFQEFSS